MKRLSRLLFLLVAPLLVPACATAPCEPAAASHPARAVLQGHVLANEVGQTRFGGD